MANPEKIKSLWLFGFVAILLFSCKDKPAKPADSQPKVEEHEHNLKAQDTTTFLWRISTGKERELNALSKRNRNEYARTILKQYAFCNCLYQAFRSDSTLFATDNSNGFLSRDLVAHSNDVIDTVSKVVKTYVSSMQNSAIIAMISHRTIAAFS